MSSAINNTYTLIIPTYNRHKSFCRLIHYLENRGVGFRILVLDSSEQAVVEKNALFIGKSGLRIRHEKYDEATPPYRKFYEGVQKVETPYCSFCADDDIVLTDSLSECIDFLDQNPFYIAAQGYYLNFRETEKTFDITYTICSGDTISGDDAIKRLCQQCFNYEVLFYAVYRAPILKNVLASIQPMQSLLFLELLASSLSLVYGGVYRLKNYFFARSTDPSIASEGWHPHQFLAIDPESMFQEYRLYRRILIEALEKDERVQSTYDSERIKRMVDLAHLHYLSPMLDRGILEYILSGSREGLQPNEIIRGIWDEWVFKGSVGRFKHPQKPYPMRFYARKMRIIKEDLFKKWSIYKLGKWKSLRKYFDPYVDYWIESKTVDGMLRRYLLYDECLYQTLPGGKSITPHDIDGIISHLNNYS